LEGGDLMDQWGLQAICARMGWKDQRAPVRHLLHSGFPMYKRRHGQHPRPVWYTNDALIGIWELARCRVERDMMLARVRTAPGEKS